MALNVQYDHQIFDYQTFGGISRYFFELIRHSLPDIETQFNLTVKYSHNEYISDRELSNHYSFGKNYPIRIRRHIFTRWNQLYSLRQLKKCDLFHPTYYDDYYLKSIQRAGIPFALTIFDMIHENLPQFFSMEGRVPQLKRKMIQEADLILAISDSTRSDLVREFNIPENKVFVTHLASSLESLQSQPIPKLPKQYLLYVGRRDTYKNFSKFYSGVKDLLKSDNLILICAGSEPFSNSELSKFSKDGHEDRVVHISYENDQQLKYLYENAIAFIFPSLYEGFGIPIVEAFSAKCPVILSDIPCFREIAGHAAIFFDPDSSSDIYEKVSELIKKPDMARELRISGKEELKRFSWAQTYEKTKAAYETIL